MKNLFDPAAAAEIKERLARLTPTSQRQWGKMTPAQALAHCSTSMETALGDKKLPRSIPGRLFGGLVKPLAIGNDKPFKRNSPTAPGMVVSDERQLDEERQRLSVLIDRFVAGGPAVCSDHPHAFFGKLNPDEWAVLMYKHADHHLRQFGA